jgi:hypothetical protein
MLRDLALHNVETLFQRRHFDHLTKDPTSDNVTRLNIVMCMAVQPDSLGQRLRVDGEFSVCWSSTVS